MLEKNAKKLIFDAHFHYFDCKKLGILDFPKGWSGISCAHSPVEWEVQKNAPDSVIQSYGIHPQSLCRIAEEEFESHKLFLEDLLESNQIKCIGEAGFDYYTDEYKATKELQENVFCFQLDLAIKYGVPLIVHCRKANEKLFEYAGKLSKVPEVLFHSFMGSAVEAQSLLNKGINGYYSFGKQIFNNNKKVIECIKKLPEERVLSETDAPFQFLKGEDYTTPAEIIKIMEGIENLKREK